LAFTLAAWAATTPLPLNTPGFGVAAIEGWPWFSRGEQRTIVAGNLFVLTLQERLEACAVLVPQPVPPPRVVR